MTNPTTLSNLLSLPFVHQGEEKQLWFSALLKCHDRGSQTQTLDDSAIKESDAGARHYGPSDARQGHNTMDRFTTRARHATMDQSIARPGHTTMDQYNARPGQATMDQSTTWPRPSLLPDLRFDQG